MYMQNRYYNQKVLVLGMAKSGFQAAKLLVELGAEVTLNDQKDLKSDPNAQALEKLGVKIISAGHPSDLLDNPYDLMVKNPGIPYDNPVVKEALTQGLEIITEVELATSVMKGHLIGVTGTNGKTTTTMIIKEMLALDRREGHAYALGNIGRPASQLALETEQIDDLVIELSSFQLMGTPTIHPEIAVITNITQAHLDYHGTREAYVEAKLNLVKNQKNTDYLIYNADQDGLKELLLSKSDAQLIPFSRKNFLLDGVSVKDQAIYFRNEQVALLSHLFIKGKHNLENFLAAIAVAKIKNVSNDKIQQVMKEFTGVKHRTQYVREWNGRIFYNDSKATNIEATEKALTGFQQPIILLAGGLDRGDDFSRLIPSLEKNAKALITFGETAEAMRKTAEKAGIKKIKEVNEMMQAVDTAYKMSDEGDVILLSPAAASWDQYKNFEVRGDKFIKAIDDLIKKENN